MHNDNALPYFRPGDFVRVFGHGWGRIEDEDWAQDGWVVVNFGEDRPVISVDQTSIECSLDRHIAAINGVKTRDFLFRANGYTPTDEQWLSSMLKLLTSGQIGLMKNKYFRAS